MQKFSRITLVLITIFFVTNSKSALSQSIDSLLLGLQNFNKEQSPYFHKTGTINYAPWESYPGLDAVHPVDMIWDRIPYNNPQINFAPSSLTPIPIGDFDGDGVNDFMVTTTTMDERPEHFDEIVGKTLIYSLDFDLESPSYFIYDYLVPMGDFDGDGKTELYSVSTGKVYGFGTDVVEKGEISFQNSVNWLQYDLDGDGMHDGIYSTSSTLTVYFGHEQLERIASKTYTFSEILIQNDIDFSSNFEFVSVFELEGISWIGFRSLVTQGDNSGQYLLLMALDSQREPVLKQFDKFTELNQLHSNNRSMPIVYQQGSLSPVMLYSNFAGQSQFGTANFYLKYSEDEKIFIPELVPIFVEIPGMNTIQQYTILGDIDGNGATEILISGWGYNVFEISESDETIIKTKLDDYLYTIYSQNAQYNIFGDINGDGRDDFIIPYRALDSSPKGFQLVTVNNEGNYTQIASDIDFNDYRTTFRTLLNYASSPNTTTNDFVIYERVSRGPSFLEFHRSGENWKTPYRTWELPEHSTLVSMISGNFTESSSLDHLLLLQFYDLSDINATPMLEIWMVDFESGEVLWVFPDIGFDPNMPNYPSADTRFIRNIGDINNSGFDDLFLSTGMNNPNFSGIIFGENLINKSTLDHRFDYTSPVAATLGDINQDGIDDFAIGVPLAIDDEDNIFGNNNGRGQIHIYYGDEEIQFETPDKILKPDVAGLTNGDRISYLGAQEIVAGDYFGDGGSYLLTKTLSHSVSNNSREGVPGTFVYDLNSNSNQPVSKFGLHTDFYRVKYRSYENYGELLPNAIVDFINAPGQSKDQFVIRSHNAVLYEANEDKQIIPKQIFIAPSQISGISSSIVGDFNGDGKLNLMVTSTNNIYRDGPVHLYDIDITDVSISEMSEIPSKIALHQNYPNPFNPTTQINFSVSQTSNVKLEVFDLLGRLVDVLVESKFNAGYHTATFNAQNLSSGMYIYRLVTDNHTISKKMLLMK